MTIEPGTTVRVYRNLTKATYSIQTHTPGKGWRVAGHADALTLRDASFKVYQTGRHRVIAKGQKNVHAYIIGTLKSLHAPHKPDDEGLWVHYNPYRNDAFTTLLGPVKQASRAYLTPTGVHIP